MTYTPVLPNDPALPFTYQHSDGQMQQFGGLTIREYMALHLTAGLAASTDCAARNTALAKGGVILADALIAALNEIPQ